MSAALRPEPQRPTVARALEALDQALGSLRGGRAAAFTAPGVSPARSAADYERQVAVASLLHRVRGELLVSELGLGAADGWKIAPLPAPTLREVTMPRLDSIEEGSPGEPRDAQELLRLRDAAFVDAAFRAVLRREADPEGRGYFLDALRSGRLGRAQVLGLLRGTAEGQAAGATLPGLGAAIGRGWVMRIPILGPLVRLARWVARLPGLAERLERLENLQAAIPAAQQRFASGMQEALHAQALHMNHQFWMLVERVNALAAADADRRSNVHHIAERLLAIDAAIGELRERVEGSAMGRPLEVLADGVRDVLGALHDHAEALAADIANARGETARVREEARGFQDQVRVNLEDASEGLRNAGIQLVDLTAGLHALAAESRGAGAASQARLDTLEKFTAEARAGLNNAGAQLVDLTAGLHGLAAETRSRLQALGEVARDQRRVLSRVATAPTPDGSAPMRAESSEAGAPELLDAFYAEFERRFRGSREEVRARLDPYLPLVRATVSESAPLLDLGCGRGELLEMLRDAGLAASGIDINATQVEECRRLGLAVAEGDALASLRALPDGSLGAVSALHVVEHLPLATLLAILDEAHRAVKRGGLLVLETPNPENLIVGACTFWLDPTHSKPVPPGLLQYLVEAAGFEVEQVLRLNPFPESEWRVDHGREPGLAPLLDGPRDYAVVGRRT